MIYGITMGDSSGVGPEILLRAFRDGQLLPSPVVFGDLSVLELCNRRLGYGVSLRAATSVDDLRAGWLNILDAGRLREEDVTPGLLNGKSGAAARDYVVAAAQAALDGRIAAMVTLPMNKEATRLSDPVFTGHTELIGSVCGVRDVTIMLASEQLIVTHVSTHVSLRTAIERVK